MAATWTANRSVVNIYAPELYFCIDNTLRHSGKSRPDPDQLAARLPPGPTSTTKALLLDQPLASFYGQRTSLRRRWNPVCNSVYDQASSGQPVPCTTTLPSRKLRTCFPGRRYLCIHKTAEDFQYYFVVQCVSLRKGRQDNFLKRRKVKTPKLIDAPALDGDEMNDISPGSETRRDSLHFRVKNKVRTADHARRLSTN